MSGLFCEGIGSKQASKQATVGSDDDDCVAREVVMMTDVPECLAVSDRGSRKWWREGRR
jgi:hypothetical protein